MRAMSLCNVQLLDKVPNRPYAILGVDRQDQSRSGLLLEFADRIVSKYRGPNQIPSNRMIFDFANIPHLALGVAQNRIRLMPVPPAVREKVLSVNLHCNPIATLVLSPGSLIDITLLHSHLFPEELRLTHSSLGEGSQISPHMRITRPLLLESRPLDAASPLPIQHRRIPAHLSRAGPRTSRKIPRRHQC